MTAEKRCPTRAKTANTASRIASTSADCMNAVAVETQKERVAVLIKHQSFRQRTVEKPVVELHQSLAEDRGIHGFRRTDNWPKSHQRENVTLNVDAGRDLDQFEAFRRSA